MVGGGIKRDDGLPAISSTNIFSALESRRRKSGKKRADKDRSDFAGAKDDDSSLPDTQRAPQVWKPTPVTVSSWADCEDDDDFFATPSLPPPMWSSNQPSESVDVSQEDLSQGEETEGDEEIEEEPEEENEEEPETETTDSAGDVKLAPMVPTVAREPDRQLSRKELRKKELAELEAVLAELGLHQKEENDPMESTGDKKEDDADGDADGEMENIAKVPTATESKSSKRRKAKKEKSLKDGRDGEVPLDTDSIPKDEVATEDAEDNSGPADPKEVLMKRLASMKKKKSSKESDRAAKAAAAAEAAARAIKLAAAKKREKNHYNQQPVR